MAAYFLRGHIMSINIENPEKYAAALYLRLSKEDDNKAHGRTDNSQSIENQKGLLIAFAEGHKIKVYDTYIDDGLSGTLLQRPELQRMCADIESGHVNMVITKDMSRLSRDYLQTGNLLEVYFPEHSVRYLSVTEDIDTGSPDYSEELTPFKAVFNEMYAKDISKKIISVKRDKQRKGQFIGGKAPYGYKKSGIEKNKIVIDESAAEIVRMIFTLAKDGKSCRQIAGILNEQHIPTPAAYAGIHLSKQGAYSGLWSSERISEMLQNEVYIGNMVQGRMQKVSYKSKKCRKLPKGEWIVVKNTHEPIVSRETFETAGMLLNSRRNTRSRTYDFLLKGLIFCHECGYPLAVIKRTLAGGKEALYFVCRTYQRFTKSGQCTCHTIREETVTQAVLEQVRTVCQQYLDQVDMQKLTLQAQKKLEAEKRRQGKDAVALKKQLEELHAKIDKVYDDHLSGTLQGEDFQRIYKKLKEQESILHGKLAAIKPPDRDATIDSQKVKELVTQFFEASECTKELLVKLVERIELTSDKRVLIFFKFKELDLASRL